MLFNVYHCLSFLLPPGIHLFLITSSPSLLMSPRRRLTLTSPASLPLCVSCPLRLSGPVFSAGVWGAGPKRVLVSQVFIKLSAMPTRTNCVSLLLQRIPNASVTFSHEGRSASL